MNPAVLTRSPYTFLPSGILIVEPHEGLLAARTALLTATAQGSGVSHLTGFEARQGRRDGHEVAIAILSESLGRSVLSATAHTIRVRWPRARILILGQTTAAIEDNLYDARMDHKARPQDLLAALVALSEDPSTQQNRPAQVPVDQEKCIPGKSPTQPTESDPTKRYANAPETIFPHDMPSAERRFRRAS